MTSLKTKIFGIITIIVVTIVSVSSLVTLKQQNATITGIAQRNTAMLTETIKGSITDAMLSGHSGDIRKIFSQISNQKLIKTLRIIDESGKVLNSANPEEIGKTAFSRSLLAYKKGITAAGTYLGDNEFVSISPILNSPACLECHDRSVKVLGLLEIETPTDYLKGFLSTTKRETIFTAAIIILLQLVSIFFFLVIYLDTPLKSLLFSMQQIEEGKFVTSPICTSSREMHTLSRQFNRMVKRLQILMDSAVKNEGELVRTQEKLAHHMEIHLMNEQLEEQLREIESLNISLKERIEEIEEANYKIADLAGELEDKNTTLEQAVARLSTLQKVGLGISSTMETAPLFDLIVKSTMETLQGEKGFITLYEPESDTITVSTLHGHHYHGAEPITMNAQTLNICSWVIANKLPLLIPDLNEYPQFGKISPLGFEQKSVICVPLHASGNVIGTINVVNRIDQSPFTGEDLELLITIGSQADIAIKNASLYEDQQRNYLSTIQSLVSAIEASDSYTRGHSERVTNYSLMLARGLELSAERLCIIERAAILHDIGKIGIDLAILHKRGALTPAEILHLRDHPLIGMRILEPIGFLQDVRTCIGQHHERFDGGGYPYGHPADLLLLESRILAIADAFDAMTSDRPYRNAMLVAEAVRELYRNAGTQFDPELVNKFVAELIAAGIWVKPDIRPTEFSESISNSIA
ncbi:cyclic di-GMP phosphodiesterase response regulator RpfG [Geobacter sp. OR-1]|uniref:HD domain-containing phosphohydrolase n=1 Tax=Geobacter sp. OR-1 TaxID=1266765 RepID=UPI00054215F6|nr:HD domain-containing phosphohydrolase [Geobacter sp. OR-1]GAM08057.1 cyclic di-GMP phosphodiesterase response regulator RpfG [Geobacter sp. OR-1]